MEKKGYQGLKTWPARRCLDRLPVQLTLAHFNNKTSSESRPNPSGSYGGQGAVIIPSSAVSVAASEVFWGKRAEGWAEKSAIAYMQASVAPFAVHPE